LINNYVFYKLFLNVNFLLKKKEKVWDSCQFAKNDSCQFAKNDFFFFNNRVYFSDKFNVNYEKKFFFVLSADEKMLFCMPQTLFQINTCCFECLYCHFGKKKKFFVRLIICIINPPNFILILLHYKKKKNPQKRFDHSNRCNPLRGLEIYFLISNYVYKLDTQYYI